MDLCDRSPAFITMSLCGLWHGAGWTFVIWGVWHGAGLVQGLLGIVFHYPFGFENS